MLADPAGCCCAAAPALLSKKNQSLEVTEKFLDSIQGDYRFDVTVSSALSEMPEIGRNIAFYTLPILVPMVNLVNTLMTNLLARQQELGILQSVGMTGKQVSRMLIAECLWYAGVTVFLSVGIGGILGWIFDYVISNFNIFGELSYQFPLMETVVFVLALLVVTGIFSVVAVRYSKRLSLVERIKTMVR